MIRTSTSALTIKPKMRSRYSGLTTSQKFILIVFMIWLAQALPKWTAAVTADGEMSAQIMKIFITPKGDKSLSAMH
ncbi:MAG: hypothetical protein QNJ56_00355 [Gammaproteobacteria bacterium]|nr:hypothetical protein [Gammaproteobacteria bacterium]